MSHFFKPTELNQSCLIFVLHKYDLDTKGGLRYTQFLMFTSICSVRRRQLCMDRTYWTCKPVSWGDELLRLGNMDCINWTDDKDMGLLDHSVFTLPKNWAILQSAVGWARKTLRVCNVTHYSLGPEKTSNSSRRVIRRERYISSSSEEPDYYVLSKNFMITWKYVSDAH